jgi:uncharacterized protein YbcC (UPF0753/DUF2309 family)
MLTTLSGWASYVKYLGEWKCDDVKNDNNQIDYLAVRLVITLLMWGDAKSLLLWHQNIAPRQKPEIQMLAINKNEKIYQKDLIKKLLISTKSKSEKNIKTPDAQFVFCIDVRSEPIRRALESKGAYETFGFAGFFGIPVKIENEITKESVSHVEKRSVNWAETRPEWGLARNASFIVAKRDLTKNIDLDGRSFLHSYDWQKDVDGSALNLILTAPMVVAQWINSQYLFSTINNVAFGSGSKITQNIVAKIGVMQGNASDLMHGLPLQSVFSNDHEAYHQPLRLTTFVHAPTNLIDKAIYKNEILQKLFSNGWVHLFCLDPKSSKIYSLQQNLIWQEYQ